MYVCMYGRAIARRGARSCPSFARPRLRSFSKKRTTIQGCMYVCICLNFVCMYVWIYVCMYVCMYVCSIWVCMYEFHYYKENLCMNKYGCKYVCMYVCMHVFILISLKIVKTPQNHIFHCGKKWPTPHCWRAHLLSNLQIERFVVPFFKYTHACIHTYINTYKNCWAG